MTSFPQHFDVPAHVTRFPCRGDWIAVLGYSLLALVLYHKTWLRGEIFFGGDIVNYHGPNLKYLSQRLAQGSLPLWNPYVYGGTPFLVSPQTGVFYPPNWIGLFFAPDVALTVLGIAHLMLGAGLMYLFCRRALG